MVFDFLRLDGGTFVRESLELEDFFPRIRVLLLDVVSDGEAVHRGFTEAVADVVKTHLVFVIGVRVQGTQEVDKIGVGVGLEVGEEDDIVVGLKAIVE